MRLATTGTRPRPAAVLAVLGLSLGTMGIFATPAIPMAQCTSIGGSAVCDGDVSHTEVGRRVIFPHGPPGERAGDFVVRPEGTLPQALPRPSETPESRPLNRADGLTDPRRGEDFGAFQFPSGPPPSGLSPTGPLR